MRSGTEVYPVLIRITDHVRELRGKERVHEMSRLARVALAQSSKLSGLEIPDTPKDTRGAPLPVAGIYWSVSHKPDFAAGVCSKFPIGIDIEQIRPRGEQLLDYVANQQEWKEFDRKDWYNFFRIFTSKEAVLKLTGDGIGLLGRCRVKKNLSDKNLLIEYRHELYRIEQHDFYGHIASITGNFSERIKWTLIDE